MHVLNQKKFMKTSRVSIEKVNNSATSKWGKHENEKRKKNLPKSWQENKETKTENEKHKMKG